MSGPLTVRAVGYKGQLGCIEILKAKAAIMSDKVCMNKAQEEEDGQRRRRRRRGEGNN